MPNLCLVLALLLLASDADGQIVAGSPPPPLIRLQPRPGTFPAVRLRLNPVRPPPPGVRPFGPGWFQPGAETAIRQDVETRLPVPEVARTEEFKEESLRRHEEEYRPTNRLRIRLPGAPRIGPMKDPQAGFLRRSYSEPPDVVVYYQIVPPPPSQQIIRDSGVPDHFAYYFNGDQWELWATALARIKSRKSSPSPGTAMGNSFATYKELARMFKPDGDPRMEHQEWQSWPFKVTLFNFLLMCEGYPPLDPTGVAIELHHWEQDPNGPLIPLQRRIHLGKVWYKVFHPHADEPTKIDRAHFDRVEKPEFWRRRATRIYAQMGNMEAPPGATIH